MCNTSKINNVSKLINIHKINNTSNIEPYKQYIKKEMQHATDKNTTLALQTRSTRAAL